MFLVLVPTGREQPRLYCASSLGGREQKERGTTHDAGRAGRRAREPRPRGRGDVEGRGQSERGLRALVPVPLARVLTPKLRERRHLT